MGSNIKISYNCHYVKWVVIWWKVKFLKNRNCGLKLAY